MRNAKPGWIFHNVAPQRERCSNLKLRGGLYTLLGIMSNTLWGIVWKSTYGAMRVGLRRYGAVGRVCELNDGRLVLRIYFTTRTENQPKQDACGRQCGAQQLAHCDPTKQDESKLCIGLSREFNAKAEDTVKNQKQRS